MEAGFTVAVQMWGNDQWPYVALIEYQRAPSWATIQRDMKALMGWCADQFGEEFHVNKNDQGRWCLLSDRFYFRDEDSAFAFKMRWSGWQSSPLTGV